MCIRDRGIAVLFTGRLLSTDKRRAYLACSKADRKRASDALNPALFIHETRGVTPPVRNICVHNPVSYTHLDVYKRQAACSAPLIVPDDDLSGTFAFLRAIEDAHGRAGAQSFADAWLNYVIENKTIFWWGGYGRSAEHTAYILSLIHI